MEREYVFAVGFKIPDNPSQFVKKYGFEKTWNREWWRVSVKARKRFDANKKVQERGEDFAERQFPGAKIVFKKLLEVNEI